MKPSHSSKSNTSLQVKPNFFDKSDAYFMRFEKQFLWLIGIVSVLFSLLLFDTKVSIAGDDAGYVIAAKQLLEGTNFPTGHGFFYPVFLSLFMALLGNALLLFKVLSLICVVTSIIVLYYAFRNIIQPTILFLVIILFSLNSQLLFFSSQTFSEPLFLLLQSCAFLVLFRLLPVLEIEQKGYFTLWRQWLLFGLLLFLLSSTRNVGLSMLLATVVYFSLQNKFVDSIITVISFCVFYIPFFLYKQFVWHVKGFGFESQLEGGFSINPYNSSQGSETVFGLIKRFFINADIFLSKQLFIILGLKNEISSESNVVVTVILFFLFFILSYLIYRRNKKIFYLIVYIAISLGVTFFTQQVFWSQSRLILIYAPFIMLLLGYSLYVLVQNKYSKLQPVVFTLFILLLFISFLKTMKKVTVHYPILVQNISGNTLYGYSPDWIHYIDMCKWVATNVPSKTVVGVRKPEIATIYSNRDFLRIAKIPSSSFESIDVFKTHTFVIYKMYDANNLFLSDSIFLFRNYLACIVRKGNDDIFGVFDFTNSNKQSEAIKKLSFIKILQSSRFEYYDKLAILKNTSNNDYVFYPDSILGFLKSKKVAYLIDANLRVDTHNKSEQTINTINLICSYVYLKYPDVFEMVHHEGARNDEPAILYKVHYPL